LKNSIYELKRTKEIIFVLAKNGFGEIIETLGIPVPLKKEVKLSRSERIRKTIEELGPTFIKLAQLLSLRPDLIPLDLAKELEKLQDRVAPLPFSEMEKVLVEEFGDYKKYFKDDFELLASASVGQVYKTRLINGDEVAVKILKPGIEEIIYADIFILERLARLVRERLLIYGIDSVKIIEEFAKSIKKELDFNIEALNLKRFKANFKNNPKVKVPKLYDNLSTKRVLTLEFINGIKINNKKLLAKYYNVKEIAKTGVELVAEQIFVHRFFHADPHPGNLMVSEGKIVFLDFGIVGRISKEERNYLLKLVYYVAHRDEEKAAEYVIKLSRISDETDLEMLKKESAEIISTYLYQPLKNINLQRFFEDLIRVMKKYKVYFKEDQYLLAKTIVTYEGVGKSLDPEFNVIESLKPYVTKLVKKIYSPKTLLKEFGEYNQNLAEFFIHFPNDLYEIIKKVKEGKLKIEFEHVGLEEFEETIKTASHRLSLSIIIASILIGSSMLLSSHIPPLIKDISLFGIIGFIFAFILAIILIFKSWRD